MQALFSNPTYLNPVITLCCDLKDADQQDLAAPILDKVFVLLYNLSFNRTIRCIALALVLPVLRGFQLWRLFHSLVMSRGTSGHTNHHPRYGHCQHRL